MSLNRILLWAMVATVVVSGLCYAVFTYVPPLARLVNEPAMILLGGLFMLVYLTAALVCAVGAQRGRAPRLMRSGIIVGGAGLLMLYAAMISESDLLLRIALGPVLWAGLMGVIGLLLLPRWRPGWWTWARWAAIELSSLLAVIGFVSGSLVPDGTAYLLEEILARIAAAVALLAGGAVVAMLLGVWVPGLARPPAAGGAPRPYWLCCPRCAAEQQATTGEYRCAACGLGIRVEVA